MPIIVPIITEQAKKRMVFWFNRKFELLFNPITPDIEFEKTKSVLAPVIFFVVSQLKKNKIGDKNTPPPIPINPEKNPINEPIENLK